MLSPVADTSEDFGGSLRTLIQNARRQRSSIQKVDSDDSIVAYQQVLRISRLPRTFSTAWPILDIITVYEGRRAGPVPGNPGGVAFSSFRRSRAQGQWIFWAISTGSLYQPKTWIQLSTGLKRRISLRLERDVK